LGAGAESDAEVLKDNNGLPYIPGKTIKGLLKHAANEIVALQNEALNAEDKKTLFGDLKKAITPHFSSATLPDTEKKEIISNGLEEYLYKNLSSTEIDKKGTADEKSLRIMEVCMPLTLCGTIENATLEHKIVLEKTLPWVRHIGTNRNRGLGRCTFKMETV
jgi:CRISPR/Cas system CSM-associated protein Csm3 (group 7 of RAMP superfamily)